MVSHVFRGNVEDFHFDYFCFVRSTSEIGSRLMIVTWTCFFLPRFGYYVLPFAFLKNTTILLENPSGREKEREGEIYQRWTIGGKPS